MWVLYALFLREMSLGAGVTRSVDPWTLELGVGTLEKVHRFIDPEVAHPGFHPAQTVCGYVLSL